MSPKANPPAPRESLGLTLYRRFFLAGIVLLLTAGAGWGVWLLWEITVRGSFTRISIHYINAHAQVQVFGWMGMFIMGFAYQMLPGMWSNRLVAPRLARASFSLMLVGLILTTGALATSEFSSWAEPAVILGGCLQFLAVAIFAFLLVTTFRQSPARLVPWVGFVFGAVIWFVVMTVANLWFLWRTIAAPDMTELIWIVATYQNPLRDLQFHGLALFMILGVAMRLFPLWFGLKPVAQRTAWVALVLLATAVVSEVILFVAYRWTGDSLLAAFLLLPWMAMGLGIGIVVAPWKLWRPFPRENRSGRFVRASFVWLAVALGLLILMPVYQQLSNLPFSHAYLGAMRHSFTVGFVSQMILAMAGRVIPALSRVPVRTLRPQLIVFVLLNGGGAIRVAGQILTDWDDRFFAVTAVGGVLTLAAFALWGLGLIGMLLRSTSSAASH